MGKGAGVNIDMDFILRLVELILLILALIFFFLKGNKLDFLLTGHRYSLNEAIDALSISCCAFIILLCILLGQKLIQNEDLEQELEGCLMSVGAVLLITCGVVVTIYSSDYDQKSRILIGGIMGILSGAAMVVHALKDFNVF